MMNASRMAVTRRNVRFKLSASATNVVALVNAPYRETAAVAARVPSLGYAEGGTYTVTHGHSRSHRRR